MKFIFDRDTWQEIYGSIRKNKMRTGITIIGVMWGIFLLVVLLGLARGVENNFNKLFGSFATNSVFVWAQQTSKPFKGFQEGKQLRLKMSDVQNIRTEIEGLEFVVPRHQSSALVVKDEKTGNFGIYGDYPELDKVQKKDLMYGRFINDNDILERKKVCVIEEEIYKQFFEKKQHFKEVSTELKEKVAELQTIKEKLEGLNVALKEEAKIKEEKSLKEKAAEVEEKINKRKKLTTEDLLVMQRSGK